MVKRGKNKIYWVKMVMLGLLISSVIVGGVILLYSCFNKDKLSEDDTSSVEWLNNTYLNKELDMAVYTKGSEIVILDDGVETITSVIFTKDVNRVKFIYNGEEYGCLYMDKDKAIKLYNMKSRKAIICEVWE